MTAPVKPTQTAEKLGIPSATTKPGTLAIQSRGIVDIVTDKIHGLITSGQLHMPMDYSPENALKSAWLILRGVVDKNGNPALSVCTRDSIANSLLDMIVQGLNPGKKQLYFIPYGKTLTCQRSYFGSMAVAQMVNPRIGDWGYAVVYEGDKFKYSIHKGKKEVQEHIQDIKNVDKKSIVAAYCMALDKGGEPLRTEIMTMAEILQSWKQSKMNPIDEKGGIKPASTHGKFTSDMVLRTVINKCCKIIINSSSDNALLLARINRNEDLSDAAASQVEIDENANTGGLVEIPAENQSEHPDKTAVAMQYECPNLLPENSDGIMVTADMCESCKHLKGCPAHDRDAKADKDGRRPGF